MLKGLQSAYTGHIVSANFAARVWIDGDNHAHTYEVSRRIARCKRYLNRAIGPLLPVVAFPVTTLLALLPELYLRSLPRYGFRSLFQYVHYLGVQDTLETRQMAEGYALDRGKIESRRST